MESIDASGKFEKENQNATHSVGAKLKLVEYDESDSSNDSSNNKTGEKSQDGFNQSKTLSPDAINLIIMGGSEPVVTGLSKDHETETKDITETAVEELTKDPKTVVEELTVTEEVVAEELTRDDETVADELKDSEASVDKLIVEQNIVEEVIASGSDQSDCKLITDDTKTEAEQTEVSQVDINNASESFLSAEEEKVVPSVQDVDDEVEFLVSETEIPDRDLETNTETSETIESVEIIETEELIEIPSMSKVRDMMRKFETIEVFETIDGVHVSTSETFGPEEIIEYDEFEDAEIIETNVKTKQSDTVVAEEIVDLPEAVEVLETVPMQVDENILESREQIHKKNVTQQAEAETDKEKIVDPPESIENLDAIEEKNTDAIKTDEPLEKGKAVCGELPDNNVNKEDLTIKSDEVCKIKDIIESTTIINDKEPHAIKVDKNIQKVKEIDETFFIKTSNLLDVSSQSDSSMLDTIVVADTTMEEIIDEVDERKVEPLKLNLLQKPNLKRPADDVSVEISPKIMKLKEQKPIPKLTIRKISDNESSSTDNSKLMDITLTDEPAGSKLITKFLTKRNEESTNDKEVTTLSTKVQDKKLISDDKVESTVKLTIKPITKPDADIVPKLTLKLPIENKESSESESDEIKSENVVPKLTLKFPIDASSKEVTSESETDEAKSIDEIQTVPKLKLKIQHKAEESNIDQVSSTQTIPKLTIRTSDTSAEVVSNLTVKLNEQSATSTTDDMTEQKIPKLTLRLNSEDQSTADSTGGQLSKETSESEYEDEIIQKTVPPLTIKLPSDKEQDNSSVSGVSPQTVPPLTIKLSSDKEQDKTKSSDATYPTVPPLTIKLTSDKEQDRSINSDLLQQIVPPLTIKLPLDKEQDKSNSDAPQQTVPPLTIKLTADKEQEKTADSDETHQTVPPLTIKLQSDKEQEKSINFDSPHQIVPPLTIKLPSDKEQDKSADSGATHPTVPPLTIKLPSDKEQDKSEITLQTVPKLMIKLPGDKDQSCIVDSDKQQTVPKLTIKLPSEKDTSEVTKPVLSEKSAEDKTLHQVIPKRIIRKPTEKDPADQDKLHEQHIVPKLTIKTIPKQETEIVPKLTVKKSSTGEHRIENTCSTEPAQHLHNKGSDVELSQSIPKVTIKNIVRSEEETSQKLNVSTTKADIKPRVLIKPIPEKEMPKVTLKPSSEVSLDMKNDPQHSKDLAKFTIRPVSNVESDHTKPLEIITTDKVTETGQESPRIILKINKSMQGNSTSEILSPSVDSQCKSPSVDKIKLKLSKTGQHPHIVHEEQDTATSMKRALMNPDIDLIEIKRPCIDSMCSKLPPDISISPVKPQQASTPVKSQQASMPIKSQQVSTPAKQQLQTTPVKQQLQPTSTKQQIQSTPVKQQIQSIPAKQQLQSTSAKQQLQSTPAKQQLQSTPAKQQLQSTPAKQQLQSTPAKQQLQSTPAKQQQVSTPVKQPQVSPSANQPQLSPSSNQPQVSPSANQQQLSTPVKQQQLPSPALQTEKQKSEERLRDILSKLHQKSTQPEPLPIQRIMLDQSNDNSSSSGDCILIEDDPMPETAKQYMNFGKDIELIRVRNEAPPVQNVVSPNVPTPDRVIAPIKRGRGRPRKDPNLVALKKQQLAQEMLQNSLFPNQHLLEGLGTGSSDSPVRSSRRSTRGRSSLGKGGLLSGTPRGRGRGRGSKQLQQILAHQMRLQDLLAINNQIIQQTGDNTESGLKNPENLGNQQITSENLEAFKEKIKSLALQQQLLSNLNPLQNLQAMTSSIPMDLSGGDASDAAKSATPGTPQLTLQEINDLQACILSAEGISAIPFMKTPSLTRTPTRGRRGRGSRGPRGSPRKRGSSTKEKPLSMFEEDTRMSADLGNKSTPAMSTKGSGEGADESQSSMQSSANENSKSKRGRMEVGDSEGKLEFTVDMIAEYLWPQPETASSTNTPSANNNNNSNTASNNISTPTNGTPNNYDEKLIPEMYMIQEQIALYLGITSFKRKYPDIRRRQVDMRERDYIMSRNLVTETLCDLGLTAVPTCEVLDIMSADFPQKYDEYKKYLRDKAAKELAVKQRAMNSDRNKQRSIKDRAISSASSWNSTFNKERMDSRKGGCLDLQTYIIHKAKSSQSIKNPSKTNPGHYPVALVPGQFCEYYKKYSPNELRYFPLDTVLYGPQKPNQRTHEVEVNHGSQSDSSESSSSSSGSDSDSSSDDSQDEDGPSNPELMCRLCKVAKPGQDFVQCTGCKAHVHGQCTGLLSRESVALSKSYPWRCMDCKLCLQCSKPIADNNATPSSNGLSNGINSNQKGANMLRCERCDRCAHVNCIANATLNINTKWTCALCNACDSCKNTESGINSNGTTTIVANPVKQWRKVETPRGPRQLCQPCALMWQEKKYCSICYLCVLDTQRSMSCKMCTHKLHTDCIRIQFPNMTGNEVVTCLECSKKPQNQSKILVNSLTLNHSQQVVTTTC